MTRANGGLRSAIAFLTPLGGAAAPGPDALFWFPAVGAGVGLAVGGAWWLATRLWTPLVGAVIAVIIDLGLTGMLHFDGLCDAGDGLLAPLERSRRLAIMASPEIGSFGFGVGIVTLLLRVVCFGAMPASPLLVAALWTGSRTVMAGVAVGVPYARPGGLASGFLGGGSRRTTTLVAAVGTLGALLLAAAWRPLEGPLALVGLAGSAGLVIALAWRRIGGYTGDVLGAAGIIGETVGLLVAAVRW